MAISKYATRLHDQIITDRQWYRSNRIAHALAMRAATEDPEERHFWFLVLEANGWLPAKEPLYLIRRREQDRKSCALEEAA